MVLVAPRSAKLVGSHGSRATLLIGQSIFLAFLGMFLLWKEDTSYWCDDPADFLGIGVGLAGTPSSNSLTGSVPVKRVGMASGTADLQRDLGGALMTSIFGALLAAGYASAMAGVDSARTSREHAGQLQLSFASAENVSPPAGAHVTLAHQLLADSGTVTFLEGWDLTGNYTFVDLVAASTNALNGALLARRPDHFKNFTIVGVLLMALLGGLGGGITRDVLLGDVPSALTNPAYITLALLFGLIGYSLAYAKGQLFREGLFQFMTSFSLPWYAIVGAQKGVGAGIPILGCIFLAVVGPTAGRWYIDLSSGVTPKQFIRGEWFVSIAALTGLVWILTYWATANTWIALGVAFVVGFVVRVLCLWYAWEEPLARSPPASTSTATAGRCSAESSTASRSASCATSGSSSRTTAP